MPLKSVLFIYSMCHFFNTIILCEKYTVCTAAEDHQVIDGLHMIQEMQIGFDIQFSSDLRVSAVQCMYIVGTMFVNTTDITAF